MAHGYRIVQWTPFKGRFDVVLLLGVATFIAAYVTASALSFQGDQSLAPIQLLIRAFGACAFTLLTLILAIGPLARFSPRFLPLLYNRRHLGVTCFFVALAHAALVLVWYHGFSTLNPLVSLLVSNPRYEALSGFPFESLGLAGLLILFLMASTSHDFWNTVLGPAWWKALHMGVYVAYVLLVAHIMLGAVQGDKSILYAVVVGACALSVAFLHLGAAARTMRADRAHADVDAAQWLYAGAASEITDGGARILTPSSGERIAVFRDGEKIFAVSNVCRHQGGPLGEGRIVDGCITCPWHGFQYRPEDGCSPPPYQERIATYATKIEAGVIFVNPNPMPLGVATPPSLLGSSA